MLISTLMQKARKPEFSWLKAVCLAASLSAAFAVSAANPVPATPTPATATKTTVAPVTASPKLLPVKAPSTLVQVPDGRLVAPDIGRIINRGELVVALVAMDTPPFFYVKNEELVGLEIDLAKDIAKELKVNVRFDRTAKTFNEVVDIVSRQEADLGISKLSSTLMRAQKVHFSTPYLTLNHGFILNRVSFAEYARDRTLPVAIRQFKGKIGVIAKSAFADYGRRYFPNAEVKEFASWAEVLKAVEKGEIMAAYRDEFEVKRVLRADPTASLTLRTVTFKDLDDPLGIAVGLTDDTLLDYVNLYLNQSNKKLTIDKVLNALEKSKL
jgi:polar amino acid transport system substrate-binding protein